MNQEAETSQLLATEFPAPEFEQIENPLYRKFKIRLRYYVPIIFWLPQYNILHLQNDIIAGLTVASLIIPQSLSYSQALVNVPPVIGLISAFISQFIYAVFGTSRQLAVGPEALVSLLVGSSVKEFMKWRDAGVPAGLMDDIYANIQPTALLCLLIGLITFMLGFFRLGFLDSVLSRALLRGFVLAVAVVVVIEMGNTLLGMTVVVGQCLDIPSSSFVPNPFPIEKEPESPFQLFMDIIQNLQETHALTAAISFISISFLFTIKYLKKKYAQINWIQMFPEILVLVVVSASLTYLFRWDCDGVAILNTIQRNLPEGVGTFPVPTVAKMKHLFLSAVLIAVIGFVESIAVAKTYASKHNYR
jgi:MFS superfamily sulfate permease-like transporter